MMKKGITTIVAIILLLIVSVTAVTVGYVIFRGFAVSTGEQYAELEVVNKTNVTIDLSYFYYGLVTSPPRDACNYGAGWSTQYYATPNEDRCSVADCCSPNVYEYVFDLIGNDEGFLLEHGYIDVFLAISGGPGDGAGGAGAYGDSIRISSSTDEVDWKVVYVGFSSNENFLSNEKGIIWTAINGSTYTGRRFVLPVSNKLRYIKIFMPRTYFVYGEATYYPYKFQPTNKIEDLEYIDLFSKFYPNDPAGFCYNSSDASTKLVTLERGKGYVLNVIDNITWDYRGGAVCGKKNYPCCTTGDPCPNTTNGYCDAASSLCYEGVSSGGGTDCANGHEDGTVWCSNAFVWNDITLNADINFCNNGTTETANCETECMEFDPPDPSYVFEMAYCASLPSGGGYGCRGSYAPPGVTVNCATATDIFT